jgi:hypothetical protein
MKNAFDKDLKQRLDEASLQEAGLRFDKDKLWVKIEKKKAKKRIAFLPWLSHAAAIAAGLAAGIFLFVPKDRQVNDHKVIVQQKEVPVLKTIIDTVYIVKNEEQQHQKPASITIIKTPQRAPVATTQKVSPGIIDHTLPIKEEQPALAINEHVQPKVLHLTDIGNENAQSHTKERRKNTFFVTLPDRNQSGLNTETFSMLVAQKLNLKKN